MGENMSIKSEALLKAILNRDGAKINKNDIERAKNGDVSGLASLLDSKDRAKLNAALGNKEKMREILNSKEAREILGKLSGGN